MSFPGPCTSSECVERAKKVKDAVDSIEEMVAAHWWDSAVRCLLPYGNLSRSDKAAGEELLKNYSIHSRLFVSEHLTQLCEALVADGEKKQKERELYPDDEEEHPLDDGDAAILTKTLLDETACTRLVQSRFIPHLFIRILHRCVFISTLTEEEAKIMQIERSNIMHEYWGLAVKICTYDPAACRAAFDTTYFRNFAVQRLSLDEALKEYIKVGSNIMASTFIGWVLCLLRLPLRRAFAFQIPPGLSQNELFHYAKEITADFFKEPIFKQTLPTQGCCHCGRRATDEDRHKFKYCGSCRVSSYCSAECAKTAWK